MCVDVHVHVRYWSSENGRVESRYLTSLFIGHGRTDDILNHYEEATKDLDPVKTLNIGMDGPNVNLAFERELRKSREELNLPSLLCLGTCVLHTVHRSFQTQVPRRPIGIWINTFIKSTNCSRIHQLDGKTM